LILGQNFANQVTIEQLNALTLKGTKNTNIDGEQVLLSDYPFRLKSDFAIPSEIWQISGDSFDETLTTFDQTDVKFDVA
jgi:mannosyltransferase OCH1-like enzyme